MLDYPSFRLFVCTTMLQPPGTIHPNYRQAVFSITLNFPLEFTQDGLPELGSSFKEIFLVAPFVRHIF